MCWNQDISINTFLFACLTLLFVFITNTFTKYKTPFFDNPLMYLFILLVASMQLIEFFLWRNLKNKNINHQLTSLGSFIIAFQQLTLILMMPNVNTKYGTLLLFGVLIFITYRIYKFLNNSNDELTYVEQNGHLFWGWLNCKGYEKILIIPFLSLYILPLISINNNLLSFFLISSLVISLFFYYKHNTFGTMWCWSSNLFLLFFIINILIIQPFYEYNSLC